MATPAEELELLTLEQERRHRQGAKTSQAFDALKAASPEAKGFFEKSAREKLAETLKPGAEGVSPSLRREVNWKATEKGREEYLQEAFGADNVVPLPGGNYAIREGRNVRFLEDAGKTGFLHETAQDLTDFIPEATEGAAAGLGGALMVPPAVAAGTALAGPLGGAAAGVGATLLSGAGARAGRKGISSTLPGEDFPNTPRGMLESGIDTATSGVAEATAGPLASATFRALGMVAKKTPILKRIWSAENALAKAGVEQTPVSREAAALHRANFPDEPTQTVGQRSLGTPTEDAAITQEARARVARPELAAKYDTAQSVAATKQRDKIYDQVSKGQLSGEQAVNAITLSNKGVINAKQKELWPEGSTSNMYDELRADFGEEKFTRSPKAVAVIDDRLRLRGYDVDKMFDPDVPPAMRDKYIRTQLRENPDLAPLLKLRGQFDNPQTIDFFIKHRSEMGRGISKARKWDKVAGDADNRYLAKQLHNAMTEDMEEYALGKGTNADWSAGTSATRADAMKRLSVANARYREGMQFIDEQENTAMALAIKAVSGGTDLAEMSAKDMLNHRLLVDQMQKMPAPRVREIMAQARKVAPDAADDLSRQVLKNLFGDESATVSSKAGMELRSRPVDFEKVANALVDEETRKTVRELMPNEASYQALLAYGEQALRISTGRNVVSDQIVKKGGIPLLTQVGGGAAGAQVGGSGGAIAGAGVAKWLNDAWLRLSYPKAAVRAIMDPETALIMNAALKPGKISPKAHERLLRSLVSRLGTLEAQREEVPQKTVSAAEKLGKRTLGSAVYNYLSGGIEEE